MLKSCPSLVHLIAAIVFAIAPWPAAAQSNSPSSLPLTADETRQCLCLDDAITRIRGTPETVKALEDQYNQLSAELDQLRATMDVYDKAQVDNFRRIHDQREAVRDKLQVPGSGLKALIAQHEQVCDNRPMLAMNVDAVRANPQQCPELP